MKNKLSLPFVLFFTLFHCSNFLVDNGGSTEITNAIIIGTISKITSPDGFDTIPVPNEKVVLRSSLLATDTVITDNQGKFRFDSVKTGNYWLEAREDDQLGSLLAFNVLSTDTLLQFVKILKPVGGVVGQLKLDSNSQNQDSIFRTTNVFIYEIDLSLSVDSTGIFEHMALSAFHNYTFLIVNEKFPFIEDTLKANIESGKITQINNGNRSPFFTHDETTLTNFAYRNEEYRDTVHAVDPDGDNLIFSFTGHQTMTLQDSILIWTPTSGCCKEKQQLVTVQVIDNKGGYDEISWIIRIIK